MRHSTRRARVEFLFESRPIIIKAEQEVLLDIEQEIITQPKNNNNKTSTDTKEKGKTLLDIPVAGICSQNCELARPAWTRNCEVVASVCRPQQHHCQPHNNIPANNIQHQPEQQLPTRLGVVASVFTCRSVITSNKEYISFSDMTPHSHGKTKTRVNTRVNTIEYELICLQI